MNAYINTHKERFLNELLDLLRIPSVSAKTEHKKDMVTCAESVKHSLLEAGADKAMIIETDGHPIVYGEKMTDPTMPTVLVYGHYDVQPADPLELWHSGPFEPTIKDGKIFARGACDDKGQFYMHVKALELMVKNNMLKTNIKFCIEGEEEIGSPNLAKFVQANKELLKCDVILISDTAMISMDTPSIDTGVRGLSYIEVEVTGPNRDLHSGVYGGAVANPATILAKITAMLLEHFKKSAPAGVSVKTTEHHGGEPYLTPIDSKAYQAASKAIEKSFGKIPVPVRGGGSIPICSLFEKELGVKIVFMGFGLDSDNLHSPNEKYDIVNYYKGIETIPYFHQFFAE